MFAILIAFMAPIFHGMCNILDAHLSSNIFKRVTTFAFYSGITNALSIPIILCFGVPQAVPVEILPYLILVSLIDFIYVFPYFTALRHLDTSIVAALFSLGKIFIPFLAYIVVNEKLDNLQYVGFAVIIVANLVLNIDDPRKIRINKGFGMMAFVSFILAFQYVIFKKVLEDIDWVTTAVYSTTFTNIFFFSLLFVPYFGKDIRASWTVYKKNIKTFLAVEFFDRMGTVPTIVALSMLPVVVTEAIHSTQPIFVLIFGCILYFLYGDKFKEDVSKEHLIKKFICFSFIILGVVLAIG